MNDFRQILDNKFCTLMVDKKSGEIVIEAKEGSFIAVDTGEHSIKKLTVYFEEE